MAVQNSMAVRNALVDAWETAIGASAVLKIRTGAPPANCAAADQGTVLVSYSLGANWAADAVAGVKTMTSLPLTAAASAAGTAAHYRLYASDGTTCHEQGSVTATGGGGDMVLDNTNIASGQTVNINTFSKTAPHA